MSAIKSVLKIGSFAFLVFFVLVSYQDIYKNKMDFLSSIALKPSMAESYIKDEYLILPTQGQEKLLDKLLHEFDLEIIEYLDDWIRVKKKNSSEAQIVLLVSDEGKIDQEFVLKLEEQTSVHAASLNFLQNKEDACAFWQVKKTAHELPNDPLFSMQWQLDETHGINAKNAWSITKGNSKNMMAVVDRNFDLESKDFLFKGCKNREYFYENMTTFFSSKKKNGEIQNHGNDVLSILAPCTNNEIGLAGVDWYTKIFAIDTKENRTLAARMKSVLWASGENYCGSWPHCDEPINKKNPHPAKIINASFGFEGDFLNDPPYGPILDIIGRINKRGSIVVSSAGNEGEYGDRRLPAAAGGVISVGASNYEQKSAYFSNFGPSIDVLAPGENIVGNAVMLNGSSFSAPLVSGVSSLLVALNPNFSWKHIEYLLKKSAKKMTCAEYCPSTMIKKSFLECRQKCCKEEQNICSAGIVNAYEAVKLAQYEKFDIPLIDLDDYFLTLSAQNKFQTIIKIKNWGLKSGFITMESNDKHLKISPHEFYIDAAKKIGEPFIKNLLIYLDKIPSSHKVIKFRLNTQNNDFIEGIIDATALHKTNKKKLKDL